MSSMIRSCSRGSMTYMNGLPSVLAARSTRVASPCRPAIMPQHSLGRSATAWSTISCAREGAILKCDDRPLAGRSGAPPGPGRALRQPAAPPSAGRAALGARQSSASSPSDLPEGAVVEGVLDVVDVVGPDPGRQVLPAAVADDT